MDFFILVALGVGIGWIVFKRPAWVEKLINKFRGTATTD